MVIRFIHTGKRNRADAERMIKEAGITEATADEKEVVLGSWSSGGDQARLFIIDVSEEVGDVDIEQVQVDYTVEEV